MGANRATCSFIEYELIYSNVMWTRTGTLLHRKKDTLFLTNKVSAKCQKITTSRREREEDYY